MNLLTASFLCGLLLAPMSASSQIIKRDDVRDGARGGALAGAALGAFSGNAAQGAVAGAVTGSVYMYDQSRQDDRTQMLADGLAGRPSAQAQQSQNSAQQQAPKPASPTQNTSAVAPDQVQVTVGDVGQSRLQNFVGDWDLETWSLAADGTKLGGTGEAKGLSAGENATRVVITQFDAPAFSEATGGGQVLLGYQPGQGFFLESDFTFSDEVLKFVGEYRADSGTFDFYQVGTSGGETATGVLRSSVRVEIRSSGAALWVADTYSLIEGQEIQIQSYRFTRR